MKTEVADPDLVKEFTADDKGRINLGIDFSNQEVKVAVERINDNNNE